MFRGGENADSGSGLHGQEAALLPLASWIEATTIIVYRFRKYIYQP
jgi:hypothetical protein